MPKYFFAPNQLQNGTITLTDETAHHLLHVLRLGIGDSIILCDGENTDYNTTIVATQKNAITCMAKTPRYSGTEPRTHITLFQSLPKGDKMDLIIQKCVELGVSEIVPVVTTRSVARTKDTKTIRYQRIAEAAAGQSMRGIIPTVKKTTTFTQAIKLISNSPTFVAYEEEKTLALKYALQPAKHINIWVGPEGGFTTEEIATLKNTGAITVTLGSRILRTETAAIATVAQILCLLEE